MLNAYADEHVAFPGVQALRQRGMDVVTVQQRGREGTNDAELLDEALRDRRIMLTNDQDFLVLAAERAAAGQPFAPIFFWPQQRRSVGRVMRVIICEASRDDYDSICNQVFFL